MSDLQSTTTKKSQNSDSTFNVIPVQSRGFGVQQKSVESSPDSKVELWENYQQAKQLNQKSANISPASILPIQAKLTIGEPGDKYEQEADSMADQVMQMPEPGFVKSNVTNSVQTQPIQRVSAEHQDQPEEESKQAEEGESIQAKNEVGQIAESNSVQRKLDSADDDQNGSNLESQLNGSKGSGSPLSDEVRGFMEPRFGADFSEVRVHTGTDAVQMNQGVNAQAFAHGKDVYFGAGKNPGNDALTAHELTHVVQQTGGIQASSIDNKQITVNPKNAIISNQVVQRKLPTETDQDNFQPEITELKPPSGLELNKEFSMPVKVANASHAPAGTTYRWSWIDSEMLEEGEATSNEAISSLKAKPKRVGSESVGVKAVGLIPFMEGASLVKEGKSPDKTINIPEVEVIWGEQIIPGNTAKGKQRDIGGDLMKLFRNDTLVITAEFQHVKAPETAGINFSFGGIGSGLNSTTLPALKWSGNKAVWSYMATSPGLVSFDISSKIPGSKADISHVANIKVVMDRTDLIITCNAASEASQGKWHEAAQQLENATTAFENAKKKHEVVLKQSAAAEELVGDLLMGAFFAGLGGFAGGAVGNIIKNRLGKAVADTAVGGGLTDAGKDTVKFATRALQKLGKSVDATDTGSGSAKATSTNHSGGGNSSDPIQWARSISSKLHGEAATVHNKLSDVLASARDADQDTEFDNIEGDPIESIKNDEVLTALKGVSTQEGDYAKAIWKTWLENYAYEFVPTILMSDSSSGAAGFVSHKVNDKIRVGINVAAEQCEESGDDWIDTYGAASYFKEKDKQKQKQWELNHSETGPEA